MSSGWLARNAAVLKTVMRIIFGIVWVIDGTLKFLPGLPSQFPQMILDAGQGQPSWIQPWFNFWYNLVLPAPAIWVYMTGIFELLLGIALVLGLLRKIAYFGGMILSLFIWAVPEGFGGPYGPGSTDIGTGIIYSISFAFLLLINAAYGPSRYSLDYLIERRWKVWAKLAEVSPVK
ncbi:MAG: DoxX family protein [Conexivisphaerales archaeon]